MDNTAKVLSVLAVCAELEESCHRDYSDPNCYMAGVEDGITEAVRKIRQTINEGGSNL